jgi:hypothetical protein
VYTRAYGGHDHLVALTNSCAAAVSCTVTSDVEPGGQTITVGARSSAQVTLGHGPASTFSPRVACTDAGGGQERARNTEHPPVTSPGFFRGGASDDCITTTTFARRSGSGYDHVVRLSNACGAPVACTVAGDGSRSITVGAASSAEVIMATNQRFESFSAEASCAAHARAPFEAPALRNDAQSDPRQDATDAYRQRIPW